jgi:pyridoxamine 5'-phosphate oxidase-like protein
MIARMHHQSVRPGIDEFYVADRSDWATTEGRERVKGAIEMDQKNLDIYGSEPIPWSRPLEHLDQFQAGPGRSTWLATARPDGQPHIAGVGALWVDGKFYFTSGAGTRKSRNLAANPSCAISISLPGIDLVVEGTAARVTDDATLQKLADRYTAQGWAPRVVDGAFTAEFSAPSAGPPPWDLYAVTATTAFGVATAEPYGATRWRFDA